MADFYADITEVANATDDFAVQELDQPFTAAMFRAQFPEFKNTAKYPDSQVSFYIRLAYKLMNPVRWGDVLDEGAALFVAHWLSLAASAAGNPNGVAGSAVGIISGGTVDKVSYTRDVSSVMEDGAGHWGMTTYGLQWLRLARMFGTGPIQVGLPYGASPRNPFVADPYGQSASLYGGAWPGPMMGPPW